MPNRRPAWRIEALLALLGTIATVAAALAAAVALLPGDDAADAIDHAHEPLLVHLLLEWPLVAVSTLLALAVALRGSAALLRHLRARRRIAPALAAAVPGELDGVAVRVIDDPRPLAFCAGLLRPRVHLSSGAVAALGGAGVAFRGAADADSGAAGADRGATDADRGAAGANRGAADADRGAAGADSGAAGADRGADAALRALVAHEAAHARRRDGLRQLAGELTAQSLFFLPALRPLGARRATLAELHADAAAVAACGGDVRPLARALLAFEAAGDAPLAIDPARIDALALAGAGDAGGSERAGAPAGGGASEGAGAPAGGRASGGAGAPAGAGGGWTPLGVALAVTLALLGLLLALPVVEFEHTSGHLLHVGAFGIELCPAPLLAIPCLTAAAVTLAVASRR